MQTIILNTLRFFIVMEVLISAIPAAQSQASYRRTLTLEEVFSLADERSETIKIYETAVEVAHNNIEVARNAFLPHVNFSASATYNGNAWVADRNFSNGQSY